VRIVQVAADGHETETRNPQRPDVAELAARLRAIAEREGKTLAALNAGLFAGQLSGPRRRTRRCRAPRTGRSRDPQLLPAKGIAVALNPIPVADLLAAASLDVALVVHLGKSIRIAADQQRSRHADRHDSARSLPH
jgi:hypothetical protein